MARVSRNELDSLEAQTSGLSAFAGAGAMGVVQGHPPPKPAFSLQVHRDEAARLWVGKVDGLPGDATAYASTLPALLQQLSQSIYDLAETHGHPEWLDWYGNTLPYQMRGDYW